MNVLFHLPVDNYPSIPQNHTMGSSIVHHDVQIRKKVQNLYTAAKIINLDHLGRYNVYSERVLEYSSHGGERG